MRPRSHGTMRPTPASRDVRPKPAILVARGGFEPPKPLGRQIYSLLRLTAPQPRRLSCPPAVATPLARAPPAHAPEGWPTAAERLPQQIVSVEQLVTDGMMLRLLRWSWRRDSNPRPADYKSAALPG